MSDLMSPAERRFWRWMLILLGLGAFALVCRGAHEVLHG